MGEKFYIAKCIAYRLPVIISEYGNKEQAILELERIVRSNPGVVFCLLESIGVDSSDEEQGDGQTNDR